MIECVCVCVCINVWLVYLSVLMCECGIVCFPVMYLYRLLAPCVCVCVGVYMSVQILFSIDFWSLCTSALLRNIKFCLSDIFLNSEL